MTLTHLCRHKQVLAMLSAKVECLTKYVPILYICIAMVSYKYTIPLLGIFYWNVHESRSPPKKIAERKCEKAMISLAPTTPETRWTIQNQNYTFWAQKEGADSMKLTSFIFISFWIDAKLILALLVATHTHPHTEPRTLRALYIWCRTRIAIVREHSNSKSNPI